MIGGSAGGVEAAATIFAALPENFPAAILLVLHLNPTVPSMLPAVLARKTRLRVVPPQDGMLIERGVIYPAPPDRHLLVDNGCLRLGRGPRENNFRPAIDPLFRTAAVAYGANVIGVILSGNLDDGTVGLIEVKRCGGRAIVQHPDDAVYSGMPANAIQQVPDVDHVLPLAEIAGALMKYVDVADPHSSNGGQPVPEDIAMGGESPVSIDERETGNAGHVRFGCPSCGGILHEYRESDLVRYRCRVGHMFSDEGLLAAQNEGLEVALWAALRALEEAAEQANALYSRMSRRGHAQLAERFKRQAQDAIRRAAIVRKALIFNQQTGEQQMPDAG